MEEMKWFDSVEELDFSPEPEEEKIQPLRIECASATDAIYRIMKETGRIGDLRIVSRRTGIPTEELLGLRGKLIFQDPLHFISTESYNVYEGYECVYQYLEGDIVLKLRDAEEMEKRYPGCFDVNVKALKGLLPEGISLEDIYTGFGAPFIPDYIYGDFIFSLLNIKVEVICYKLSSEWDIILPPEEKIKARYSKLNRTIYGTLSRGALEIMKMMLNGKPVIEYDETDGEEGKRRINRKKTIELQAKQKLILEKFQEYITSLPPWEQQNLLQRYVNSLGSFNNLAWDVDWYQIPDLNPEVQIYDYHKKHIARCVFTDCNRLICEPTGAGKTFEFIAIAHERKRMGVSEKILAVVKNGLLQSVADLHKRLFPKDEILVITPRKNFSKKERERTLQEIAEHGDRYACIYMAHSSFDLITMSEDYWVVQQENRIRTLDRRIRECTNRQEKEHLSGKRRKLTRKLQKLREDLEKRDKRQGWTYEDLGIDLLIVDEVQYYKNIPVESSNIALSRKGSRKCIEMLEKVHNTEMSLFFTATPMTNSFSELHALRRYLMPEVLERKHLDSFDMWLNTYASRREYLEADFTGNRMEVRERFDRFHNLPGLMRMFGSVLCYYAPSEEETSLPAFYGYIDVEVPKGPKAKEYDRELIRRADAVLNGSVSAAEDNPLKLNVDSRLISVDPRLRDLSADAPRFRKTHCCAEKIMEIARDYPGCCQLVFSDLGVPKPEFNLYDELKMELVNMGLSEKEIAFIHDAATDTEREKLYRKANRGEIRVLIGSTEKLGVGVNVQQKLKAIHHLTVPWRPSDIEQRNGRLIRQGNEYGEVLIFRYFMKGSFDSYMWQMQERKAREINQLLTGVIGVKDMEDLDMAVLSAAEIKAYAMGNPMIKRRMEVANKLEAARIQVRNQDRELKELRTYLNTSQERIDTLRLRSEQATQDHEWYQRKRDTIGREERRAFGEELLSALHENSYQTVERLFDCYQEFQVILPAMMAPEDPHVYLKGREGAKYHLEMKTDKPSGCCQIIDHFLGGLQTLSNQYAAQAEDLRVQQEQAQERLRQGNTGDGDVERLQKELKEIDETIMEQGGNVQ